MKLTELLNAVNTAMKLEPNPGDIDVVITTKAAFMTLGQRPYVDVARANMGFDWEAGQFRLTPLEAVMSVEQHVPQKVIEWRGAYHCPKCEHQIGKRKDTGVRFCSKCGQSICWEESD